MKDTKFVKAYCDKTKQHFGLEIKKIGGEWKVVNMIHLTPDEAKVMSSEINQPAFYTHTTLQACRTCLSRKVGGCTCAPKKFSCQRKPKYNFQCIYCREMRIDYSAAAAVQGRKDGDVIRLSQGQVVKIRLSDDRPLTKIFVGVGWDPTRFGSNMDVDSSVIVADSYAKDIVYFGNLKHSSGCVIHHGDNLTGEDRGANDDDENITVHLNKVPRNRDKLVFVLNIYNCATRHQRLGDIKNMYIRLYDPVSKKPLIEYKVDSNVERDTALIIGMAYREGSDWNFKAIGKGSRAKDVDELADECMRL